tara:strand:- start:256 stop:444 length:189 start_codon:yes stop_codon:yes gene_type:complete
MNLDLMESVEILSQHYVERFKQLRDNEQYDDADSIAQEYVCNDIEDDNYQWIFVNYQFEEKQ